MTAAPPPTTHPVTGRLRWSVGALLLVSLALVAERWWPVAPAASGDWASRSRRSQLERLPVEPGDLVLLGASLVQHGEWHEWLPDHRPRNRGVAGDRVVDVLARLDPLVAARPGSVFVMVGLNDLLAGSDVRTIVGGHRQLVQRFAHESPETQVVLLALLPVRRDGAAGVALQSAIAEANAALAQLCDQLGCGWLDMTPAFADDTGRLRAELTLDGVHLTGAGYAAWRDQLVASGWL